MSAIRREDEHWMRQALRLAAKGIGTTSPNPRVGCVIVRNGRVVGEGFHEKAGLDHAEIVALKKARKRAEGATLYSTMEPCAHYGRTPPCVSRILQAGIQRVVFGQWDPNPITRRKGFLTLKKNRLKVLPGCMEEECAELNRPFYKWVKTKTPYVTVKVAQSLDGKIATRLGSSKWISSPESREFVQKLRREADAILVGIQTVLKDNPRLGLRRASSHHPVKVILDTRLRIPASAGLFKTPGKVIIATSEKSSVEKRQIISKKAELILCPLVRGMVDLGYLMKMLAERGITHVLVEGGGEVIGTFIEQKRIDEIYMFVAPIFVGGRSAPTSVEGHGAGELVDAWKLKEASVSRVGTDFMIHGRF